MKHAKILAFAGSTRKESFNRKLLALAVELAGKADLDVRHIELADFPLPIMDEDLEAEQGQPAHATEIRRMMLDCDALMLACPEYNSSITPLMKNVIDWVSRKETGGGDLGPYKNKKALLIGASPGRFGGQRSIATVRSILGNIGVSVFENDFTLAGAADAFDEHGQLHTHDHQQRLEVVIKTFADFVSEPR
ncbi:MAG: NAD(P)H-dependent oxidoreductase [Wenzhouxiangellaceae bacterium]|nr:NAD(P)H-dependent oxidoreductase [Wenzhouxiangellaceae bacterium]